MIFIVHIIIIEVLFFAGIMGKSQNISVCAGCFFRKGDILF